MGTTGTAQSACEARPVFVVGAPRSGTSILTWALGQHPNLLATEESDWLGLFAEQAAAAHVRGSVRGERSQLSALGISRSDFLRGLGDSIDRMIRAHRFDLERRNYAIAQRDPQQVSPEFAVARAADEPKSRWVDGTPEYSLHICGLHALFPAAKFVHILRDADDVAASLLAFRDTAGQPLVVDADAAYAYWLHTTQACMLAAAALGADVVRRVRYAELSANPASSLRGILAFLDEPFAPACVEPFNRRINSSFADESNRCGPPLQSSPAIEQARQASALWCAATQVAAADAATHVHFEKKFETQVAYAMALDANYMDAQRQLHAWNAELHKRGIDGESLIAAVQANQLQLAKSRRTLNIAGILLCVQWCVALVLWLRASDATAATAALWLVLASGAALVYAWLRRVGLRAIAAKVWPQKAKQEST